MEEVKMIPIAVMIFFSFFSHQAIEVGLCPLKF
jgi:hypothetical protein